MYSSTRASARILACLAAGAALSVPLPGAGQQTVTLTEALDRALIRSPQLAAAPDDLDPRPLALSESEIMQLAEEATAVAEEDLRVVRARYEVGAALEVILGREL